MRSTVSGQEWMLIMDNEFEQFSRIFSLLLEADKKIWAAVLEIRNDGMSQLEDFVQPLMKLRGELHVEFMRPLYKRYPELAKTAGFDSEEDG